MGGALGAEGTGRVDQDGVQPPKTMKRVAQRYGPAAVWAVGGLFRRVRESGALDSAAAWRERQAGALGC